MQQKYSKNYRSRHNSYFHHPTSTSENLFPKIKKFKDNPNFLESELFLVPFFSVRNCVANDNIQKFAKEQYQKICIERNKEYLRNKYNSQTSNMREISNRESNDR